MWYLQGGLLKQSAGMFITLQLVEFYYNFIIILSTTIRLIFSDLGPRIFKISRLQIFFNFYDEEYSLTEVGYFSLLSGYRHYHMARKDKITRYYQSLMTWYILSGKEMRIGNKMVQGNGIRKIFCQLSFPDLIFSNVKMLVIICWVLGWFIWVGSVVITFDLCLTTSD